MHYTGMAAATFMPTETAVVTDGLSGAYLGMSIFGVTTVLLSAVLSISLMRQRQRELVQI
jgi:NO-binding membrane sensor protein with MHYT domain